MLRWIFRALAVGMMGCGRTEGQPPLVGLVFDQTSTAVTVTLSPAPGAKINALARPTLELASGDRVTFDGPVTADSSYFSSPPTARIPVRELPLAGTLRVGVCPAGLSVCKSLTLPVHWPASGD